MSQGYRDLHGIMPRAMSIAVLLLLIGASAASADVYGISGPPRPWHGSINAPPFSVVNVKTGQLFTALPIMGFEGRGPDISINVYHNSADVTRTWGNYGVDLGPGWSVSYSGHIERVAANRVVVVEDDGTRNKFRNTIGMLWQPSNGIYDRLIEHANSQGFTLVRKNQTRRHFDYDGRLLSIEDAAGNTLTVSWETGTNGFERIGAVTDDAGRRIDFQYAEGTNRLAHIYDPANTTTTSRDPRSWDFVYMDSNGPRLQKICDPVNGLDAPVVFNYDSSGRITGLTDKYEDTDRPDKTFHYVYDVSGKVVELHDPEELGNSARTITYTDVIPPPGGESLLGLLIPPGEPLPYPLDTRYTDRRGEVWLYRTSSYGRLAWTKTPSQYQTSYYYNTENNVTEIEDALGHSWFYGYGLTGNVTSVTDPLDHATYYTYDAYNNVTSVTDANSNAWLYAYTDANDPTALTQVTEPDDGQGNGVGITTLAYYNTNGYNGESNGALMYVEDPNGVVTWFEYDRWGQQKKEIEGVLLTPGLRTSIEMEQTPGAVAHTADQNDASHSIGASDGDVTGTMSADALGRFLAQLGCELCPLPGGRSYGPDRLPTLPGFPSRPCSTRPLSVPKGQINAQDIEYLPQGQIARLHTLASYPTHGADRTKEWEFDALGRMTRQTVDAYEGGVSHARQHDFINSDGLGEYTVEADDIKYTVTLNDDGRVASVVGDGYTTPQLTGATYGYYPNGWLEGILFDNGTSAIYSYYDDGRVYDIYYRVNGVPYKRLAYSYDPAGRLTQMITAGRGMTLATHDYTYDNRGRLIREIRSGNNIWQPYDITYTYDNGGNRTSKTSVIDGADPVEVAYHYDVDDDVDGVQAYGSYNNRLMYYVTSNGTERTTTWYYYQDEELGGARFRQGNVRRITTHRDGDEFLYGTRFEYDASGRLFRVMGDRWKDTEPNWRRFRFGGAVYEVLLSDEAMNWHDADAFAAQHGATLAWIFGPEWLSWFADTFGTGEGLEVAYWTAGHQVHDEVWWPDIACGSTPWFCWEWAGVTEYMDWLPDRVWPPSYYYNGLWLAGESDDADDVENHEEDHIVLVLNAGDDPGSNGLADVNSAGLYRALVMREAPSETLCYSSDYEELWVREFHYDGPRQRYFERHIEPGSTYEYTDYWTDYVGNTPITDYEVQSGDPAVQTATKLYTPGVAEEDLVTGETNYRHADLIGSTWFTSDDPSQGDATLSRMAVRTAFGELVGLAAGPETRYGYVGAHGYQTHDIDTTGVGDGVPDTLANAPATAGFPFIHVGARYYDPATGRFLQRDPIGIRGGNNVYAYVGSTPTYRIDPSGLFFGCAPEPDHGFVEPLPQRELVITDELRERLDGIDKKLDDLADSTPVGLTIGNGLIGISVGRNIKDRHVLCALVGFLEFVADDGDWQEPMPMDDTLIQP